jgi:TonB family protein
MMASGQATFQPLWLRPAAIALTAAVHAAVLFGATSPQPQRPGDGPSVEVTIIPERADAPVAGPTGVPEVEPAQPSTTVADSTQPAPPVPEPAMPELNMPEPAMPPLPPEPPVPVVIAPPPPPVIEPIPTPEPPKEPPVAEATPEPALPPVADATPIEVPPRPQIEALASVPLPIPQTRPPPMKRERAEVEPPRQPTLREQLAERRRREAVAEVQERRQREQTDREREARQRRLRQAEDARQRAAPQSHAPGAPANPGLAQARGQPDAGGGSRQANGSVSSGAYAAQVRAILQARADALGLEDVAGIVGLTFMVGPSGRLVSHGIARPSGNFEIDRAIRGMLASASFPPPPGGSFTGNVTVRIR